MSSVSLGRRKVSGPWSHNCKPYSTDTACKSVGNWSVTVLGQRAGGRRVPVRNWQVRMHMRWGPLGPFLWQIWVPLTSTMTFSLAIPQALVTDLPASCPNRRGNSGKSMLLLMCKMCSVAEGTSKWELKIKSITFTPWRLNRTPPALGKELPHR